MNRISKELLFSLRNKISINHLIECDLEIPAKQSEGFLRFLCPLCGEFRTATNPKTNLARCFRCSKNFNTIDLVIIVRNCTFLHAVRFLESLRS